MLGLAYGSSLGVLGLGRRVSDLGVQFLGHLTLGRGSMIQVVEQALTHKTVSSHGTSGLESR